MNSIDKLNQIISLCEDSINLNINEHRYYNSVESYFVDVYNNWDENDIPSNIYQEIIKRDTLIELHYNIYYAVGYDLDMVLDEALEILKRGY